MAKAVKKPVVKKVEEPVYNPAKDLLNLLLADMEKFVEGPGSVADRQNLVDRLRNITEQL